MNLTTPLTKRVSGGGELMERNNFHRLPSKKVKRKINGEYYTNVLQRLSDGIKKNEDLPPSEYFLSKFWEGGETPSR